MNKSELFNQIKLKQSFLCVGLDPSLEKMPKSLNGNLFEFNKAIIDATAKYAVAFKPNLAFYEVQGTRGIQAFEDTIAYIRNNYPEIFIIADAKRGDIGNTSRMYAQSFFETMGVDALTVAPYMGQDSVTPFLGYEGKWVILLGLTSNPGSKDFQLSEDGNGKKLFERVLETSKQWGNDENMMYVIGATHAEDFTAVRAIVPNNFLLVPGVGAQGGDLAAVCQYGLNDNCGLLVNSSRGIIHASSDNDFAIVAENKARELRDQMAQILQENKLL